LEGRALPRRAKIVELAFDSKSLRAVCESEAQAKLELGPRVGEILKHRLADLCAAASPKDLVVGRPRIGTDREHMIVDLCNGHRIVFKPNHTNNPKTETGDVDWEKISRIKILRIESDYA
jgi:hypothetical protein